MAIIYLASVDTDGKFLTGTAVNYPDEYTEIVSAEVFTSADRTQLTPTGWVIHDPLSVTAPATVTTGQDFDVTVTLPPNAPVSTITVSVRNGAETTEPQTVEAVNGVATAPMRFDAPGSYIIIVGSRFNGSATAVVEVSAGG